MKKAVIIFITVLLINVTGIVTYASFTNAQAERQLEHQRNTRVMDRYFGYSERDQQAIDLMSEEDQYIWYYGNSYYERMEILEKWKKYIDTWIKV